MKLKGLNETPVKCFRWLRVNDKDIEINIETGTKFSNIVCDYNDNDSYTLKDQLSKIEIPNAISNSISNIISENQNSGFSLEIKKDIEKPIFIKYVIDKDNKNLFDRNTIVCKQNSSATLILNYIGEYEDSIHMGELSIKCEKNSKLKVIKIQNVNNNFEAINIDAEEDSNIEWITLDLSQKINFVNYNCNLIGARSSNNVYNGYFGSDNDLLDFNYKISHIGRNTKGLIETKGILSDTANKTMRSTIQFLRGAKKAQGKETEFVMMLSDKVLNNSIPLLLCDEDDVAGEHAASIGRIEEEVLFYMMSRGITLEDGKKLMVLGYLNPIIDRILDEDLKQNALNNIQERVMASV